MDFSWKSLIFVLNALHCDIQYHWHLKIFTLLIRLHHYHGEDYCFCHYFLILLHFFFSDFHQTSQVGTLEGPYYTDPFSLTLTYFSGSQTHFSAKITRLKSVITLLFLARFWSNFTGIDYRSMPSFWPSLVDLDLLLQVKLDIGSKFCVVATAKTRQHRIIFSTGNYSHY